MERDATPGDTWRGEFLRSLAAGANVAEAAEAAGVHRSRPYRERARDGGFAEAWQAVSGSSPSRGGPKGRSGTVNTGGFIFDEEFNLRLRFPQNLAVYDEMRRSEPT